MSYSNPQSPISNPSLPTHLGIIMDGNRRWAKEKGLPVFEGHRLGAEAFRNVVKEADEMGIENLSAYVFSSENWSRTEEEVKYLMGLVITITKKYLKDFHKLGIKIVVLGSREKLDKKVLDAVEYTEDLTKDNTGMTLGLCFNYGGKQEIVDAAKKVVESGQELSVESISENLYSPQMPQIDLLIRTSGENRTSGYMLWRSDYAELIFIQKYWPDFGSSDLHEACAEFTRRQRRFGA